MTDTFDSGGNRKARDDRKEAHLRGILDRYTQQFRALGDPVVPSVAREVHGVMDSVLERDRRSSATSGDIRCGRGCDHCCRGPVEIWPHEAALLVEAVRAAGMELDRARLERQCRHTLDTWREQPLADRACVFLGDDGACRVYEARPNACRKLLVVSDPALCDAGKHPPESVGRWFSWEAEMMEVAALEVFGAALMPRLLLPLLGK
jgi:Fe-S-cluster containining protein